MLDCVLADIPWVCIFLDDILVTGRTQDEHVANLWLVLKRLDEAGLKLNNEVSVLQTISTVSGPM